MSLSLTVQGQLLMASVVISASTQTVLSFWCATVAAATVCCSVTTDWIPRQTSSHVLRPRLHILFRINVYCCCTVQVVSINIRLCFSIPPQILSWSAPPSVSAVYYVRSLGIQLCCFSRSVAYNHGLPHYMVFEFTSVKVSVCIHGNFSLLLCDELYFNGRFHQLPWK